MKAMMPVIMLIMLAVVISAAIFVFQGVDMHDQVAVAEGEFHELQVDYLLNNTKEDRDLAIVGSDLNAQLAEIANTPSELLRLKLVGIGKILTGIAILLFGIFLALFLMPIRLGGILKDNMKEMQEKMAK